MGVNFVICDDQISVVNSITENLNKVIEKNNIRGSIALTTTNPEDVLIYAEDNKPESTNVNAYILDVDLNANKNGLQVAKKIRETDPVSYIMFITAHLEYGMLTFKYKLRVFDYLLKPVEYNDFRKTILAIEEDYIKLLGSIDSSGQNCINIVSAYKEYKVPINEVILVESKGAKATVHTSSNVIETYTSLRVFNEKLNAVSPVFFRIHKTYLINIGRVKSVDFAEMLVEMDNGDIYAIARSNKTKFKQFLNQSELTIHYNE